MAPHDNHRRLLRAMRSLYCGPDYDGMSLLDNLVICTRYITSDA